MLEPERYELSAGPAYTFDVDRRQFFQVLGAGMLVLGLVDRAQSQESGRGGRRPGRPQTPQEVSAWMHIGEDGTISAFTGKAEVGQNTRTALTQGVAEEMRVPIDKIEFVMADTDLSPWDMGTFGSRSMPDMLPQMRRVAAAGREALLAKAAKTWSVQPNELRIEKGRISAQGYSLTYAELIKGENLLETVKIGQSPVTPPADWLVMGRDIGKVNGRDIVTGRHKYTTDMLLPSMTYGAIVRPPEAGATLAQADTTAAESMSGVTVIRDGSFLGLSAPDSATAKKAITAIKAEWKPGPQASEATLYSDLRGQSPVPPLEGLASAAKKFEATYTVAYIAHAPLEPRSAVAQWQGDKLTVWTGTQVPFGVRVELAEAFKIPETQVRVIVPDTGSGYGGKHTGEAAVEAARLAKAAGKPVKLTWSREEEFTHAYFRPAGVIDVRSGVSEDGKLIAWDFHNYNSGNSGIGTLYDVPHKRAEFHRSDAPLRQGSYRGLAATANHFAREVHMDEIAAALGKDPLEFRLQNLKDARLRTVLQTGAEKFGWGKKQNAGFAGGFEKGGYVATFAEVEATKDLKNVRVVRAVTAFECGAVVNPDALRNQIEGGVIMGIGGALYEAIHFEKGRVTNNRFSRYRVPRFQDMPVIETVLVDRRDLPSAGAGETPIVGIAPAIGNAIFRATGVRLRSLPMLTVPA